MAFTTLTLRSVSFTYDNSNKPIIEDLSVAFASGWTGLIGANGCGKSTLLKLLSGALSPSSGEIIRGRSFASGSGHAAAAFATAAGYHCRQETTVAPLQSSMNFARSMIKRR